MISPIAALNFFSFCFCVVEMVLLLLELMTVVLFALRFPVKEGVIRLFSFVIVIMVVVVWMRLRWYLSLRSTLEEFRGRRRWRTEIIPVPDRGSLRRSSGVSGIRISSGKRSRKARFLTPWRGRRIRFRENMRELRRLFTVAMLPVRNGRRNTRR